jgi:hypothetical protein
VLSVVSLILACERTLAAQPFTLRLSLPPASCLLLAQRAVKALGAALGVQVLVFNCDEGFDHGSLGRIMAGLATVGSWGCFGAWAARMELGGSDGVARWFVSRTLCPAVTPALTRS